MWLLLKISTPEEFRRVFNLNMALFRANKYQNTPIVDQFISSKKTYRLEPCLETRVDDWGVVVPSNGYRVLLAEGFSFLVYSCGNYLDRVEAIYPDLVKSLQTAKWRVPLLGPPKRTIGFTAMLTDNADIDYKAPASSLHVMNQRDAAVFLINRYNYMVNVARSADEKGPVSCSVTPPIWEPISPDDTAIDRMLKDGDPRIIEDGLEIAMTKVNMEDGFTAVENFIYCSIIHELTGAECYRIYVESLLGDRSSSEIELLKRFSV